MEKNELKSIAIFILYFGKFPAYFDTFLESAAKNITVDFYIYTDQNIEIQSKYTNIFVVNCSFLELKNNIQEKMGFKINLDRPYKLCDYKPAYGYIFEDKIKPYDFWGHCDIDLILGDIRKFVTNDVLCQFDRIYEFGHLSLYRNDIKVNRAFMEEGGMNYKDVYSSPIISVFDEIQGIQKKLDINGYATYKKLDFIDITPRYYQFKRTINGISDRINDSYNEKLQLFYYKNGKIYRSAIKNKKIITEEYIYLHFQKRNLYFEREYDNIPDYYLITCQGFIPCKEDFVISKSLIKEYNGRNIILELIYKFRFNIYIWKRRWNKYILNR